MEEARDERRSAVRLKEFKRIKSASGCGLAADLVCLPVSVLCFSSSAPQNPLVHFPHVFSLHAVPKTSCC